MSEQARKLWQEKLELLLTEEAKAFDPTAKFKIQKDIAEVRAKLAELDLDLRPEPDSPSGPEGAGKRRVYGVFVLAALGIAMLGVVGFWIRDLTRDPVSAAELGATPIHLELRDAEHVVVLQACARQIGADLAIDETPFTGKISIRATGSALSDVMNQICEERCEWEVLEGDPPTLHVRPPAREAPVNAPGEERGLPLATQ